MRNEPTIQLLSTALLAVIGSTAGFRERVDHIYSILHDTDDETAKTALVIALSSAAPSTSWSPSR